MRFYTQQHPFYCGIDLHARTMYVCILDQAGETLVHRNMTATPEALLKAIAPYREQIVVAAECRFTWYWLADLCAEHGIPFVLGHALYMKAIHGGKAKNDKIDAQKIAVLLRGGMLPQAYVYSAEMRATRDLLRRRMHLARTRGELLAHVQNTNSQYNRPAIGKKRAYKANRDGVAERCADPAVQKSIEVDLARITYYDELLCDVELTIVKTAKHHDAQTLYLLQTVPGIGKILSLVLLYEIHDIARFPRVQDFASHCRLVKCARESAGKRLGTSGAKIGNAHLKWTFSEAAVLCLRENPAAQKFLTRWEKKHSKGTALTILAHTLARAVYDMLQRQTAFDLDTFLQGWRRGAGEPDAELDSHGMTLKPQRSRRGEPLRRWTLLSVEGVIPEPSPWCDIDSRSWWHQCTRLQAWCVHRCSTRNAWVDPAHTPWDVPGHREQTLYWDGLSQLGKATPMAQRTAHRRHQALERYLADEKIEDICRHLACSKSWLDTWRARYDTTKATWAQERSTRPQHSSTQTPDHVVQAIVSLHAT